MSYTLKTYPHAVEFMYLREEKYENVSTCSHRSLCQPEAEYRRMVAERYRRMVAERRGMVAVWL